MPQPTGRQVHVDALLTNISLQYRNPDYIADAIFPMVPVEKQSNIVPKYDQSHWFRDGAKLRAPGTKSEGGGFTVDVTDKYYCDRYSYRDEVTDDDRDNADDPFSLERDAVDFVTDKIQLGREVKFAGDFFKASVWGTDKAGATDFVQWSDYGASNPLLDITQWQEDVEGKIARTPNTGVLGRQVWTKLKWHPVLIDTIKHVERGVITLDLAAALMELPKLLIGKALKTTTVEGTAEASVTYSRVWGKGFLLLYTPATPSLRTPAAGYTFVWRRVANAIQYIKRMRDEEREVEIFEGNSYFDQKAVGTQAGLFAASAVA